MFQTTSRHWRTTIDEGGKLFWTRNGGFPPRVSLSLYFLPIKEWCLVCFSRFSSVLALARTWEKMEHDGVGGTRLGSFSPHVRLGHLRCLSGLA
ncbi:hypothetical protein PENTCL1PPCAC_14649, partial [Pristionchus entomophagus]